ACADVSAGSASGRIAITRVSCRARGTRPDGWRGIEVGMIIASERKSGRAGRALPRSSGGRANSVKLSSCGSGRQGWPLEGHLGYFWRGKPFHIVPPPSPFQGG